MRYYPPGVISLVLECIQSSDIEGLQAQIRQHGKYVCVVPLLSDANLPPEYTFIIGHAKFVENLGDGWRDMGALGCAILKIAVLGSKISRLEQRRISQEDVLRDNLNVKGIEELDEEVTAANEMFDFLVLKLVGVDSDIDSFRWGENNTYLHLCSYLGLYSCMKRLLKQFAIPTNQNALSKSCLDVAKDEETLNLLTGDLTPTRQSNTNAEDKSQMEPATNSVSATAHTVFGGLNRHNSMVGSITSMYEFKISNSRQNMSVYSSPRGLHRENSNSSIASMASIASVASIASMFEQISEKHQQTKPISNRFKDNHNSRFRDLRSKNADESSENTETIHESTKSVYASDVANQSLPPPAKYHTVSAHTSSTDSSNLRPYLNTNLESKISSNRFILSDDKHSASPPPLPQPTTTTNKQGSFFTGSLRRSVFMSSSKRDVGFEPRVSLLRPHIADEADLRNLQLRKNHNSKVPTRTSTPPGKVGATWSENKSLAGLKSFFKVGENKEEVKEQPELKTIIESKDEILVEKVSNSCAGSEIVGTERISNNSELNTAILESDKVCEQDCDQLPANVDKVNQASASLSELPQKFDAADQSVNISTIISDESSDNREDEKISPDLESNEVIIESSVPVSENIGSQEVAQLKTEVNETIKEMTESQEAFEVQNETNQTLSADSSDQEDNEKSLDEKETDADINEKSTLFSLETEPPATRSEILPLELIMPKVDIGSFQFDEFDWLNASASETSANEGASELPVAIQQTKELDGNHSSDTISDVMNTEDIDFGTSPEPELLDAETALYEECIVDLFESGIDPSDTVDEKDEEEKTVSRITLVDGPQGENVCGFVIGTEKSRLKLGSHMKEDSSASAVDSLCSKKKKSVRFKKAWNGELQETKYLTTDSDVFSTLQTKRGRLLINVCTFKELKYIPEIILLKGSEYSVSLQISHGECITRSPNYPVESLKDFIFDFEYTVDLRNYPVFLTISFNRPDKTESHQQGNNTVSKLLNEMKPIKWLKNKRREQISAGRAASEYLFNTEEPPAQILLNAEIDLKLWESEESLGRVLGQVFPVACGTIEKDGSPGQMEVGGIFLRGIILPCLNDAEFVSLPLNLKSFEDTYKLYKWGDAINMQGYLSQRGGDGPNWKTRYFKLVGSTLHGLQKSGVDAKVEIDLAMSVGVQFMEEDTDIQSIPAASTPSHSPNTEFSSSTLQIPSTPSHSNSTSTINEDPRILQQETPTDPEITIFPERDVETEPQQNAETDAEEETVPSSQIDSKFKFRIVFKDGEVIEFACDTVQGRELWVQCLSNVLKVISENPDITHWKSVYSKLFE